MPGPEVPYVITFERTQLVTVGTYASSPEEALAKVRKDPWEGTPLSEQCLSLGEPSVRPVGEDEAWLIDDEGIETWPDE